MKFFALRNFKEISRDPLVVLFGLGFPIVLLLLLSAIQHNIPVELFEISNLAPGIVVFGLSFISLFLRNRAEVSGTRFRPQNLHSAVR